MEPLEVFAANVRRLRQERNLTQERLAELSDLHMTDIARIETLRRDPGVKVVARSLAASMFPRASYCAVSEGFSSSLGEGSASGPTFKSARNASSGSRGIASLVCVAILYL